MIFNNTLLAKGYINYLRLFNKTELYQPTYQKRSFFLVRKGTVQRSCEDRFDAISKRVSASSGSYLDIGSQFGYFVFKMAELGFVSTGMEADLPAYNYASNLAKINEATNVRFIHEHLDEDRAKSLPHYDIISILNVFHHIVHFSGFEKADKIMKTLYQKCDGILFFETGEYEEKGHYWSEDLQFMGKSSKEWIGDYLKKLGFRCVEEAGRFPTHLSGHKRTLFCCFK